ncbi:MAG: hypothetical protein JW973_08625 [Bacteroidales bacterium]|nr:hypothetical protein [Bacteroidales bacterium]
MNMGAYLIKTALCLFCFYLTYRVLLSKNSNYTIIRFYLVGSFVLSFVFPLISINLPLINISVVSAGENGLTEKIDPLVSGNLLMAPDSIHSESGILTNPVFLISIIYFSGILAFMIRYGLEISRLIRMIRRNRKQKFDQYTLVKLDHPVAPFSFFRYIFVCIRDITSDDFQRFILKHELTHIRNWHSLDRLFLGLGQIVQWFNPVVLLYKKAVITLHEFSADYSVIGSTTRVRDYQHRILQYACEKNHIMLSNNFSNTMMKNRFTMMTKHYSGRYSTLKVIAAIVVAAFLLLAFSSGDKVSVVSKSANGDHPLSVCAIGNETFSANLVSKDTTRNPDTDQESLKTSGKKQEDEEIRRLTDELDAMKRRQHPPDSIARLPHHEFYRDMERFNRDMAERQRHMDERQRHFAERQRQLAEGQRMLAERLRPLMEGNPCIPDAEEMKRIMEDQIRIERYRPMMEDYLKSHPPVVEPFIFDEHCRRLEELHPFTDDQLKDFELLYRDRFKHLRSHDARDPKLLEEQRKWEDKYHREMEKQRNQMEKKRKQLLDEYHQMIKKYRKENEIL